MKNHYQTLGIKETASEAEIRDAYRKLAKKLHPDVNPHNKQQAEKEFQQVSAAYNTLSNKTSRAKYDQELNMQNLQHNISSRDQENYNYQGSGFFQKFDLNSYNLNKNGNFFSFDLNSIFNMFSSTPPQPTRVKVSISFLEAALGTQKQVRIKDKILNLKIPAGSQTNTVFNVPNKDQRELQIQLQVEDSPIFHRIGLDIYTKLSYSQNYNQTKISVPTIHGPVEIKLQNIKPGQKIRLRGRGIKTPQGMIGDQYITIV